MTTALMGFILLAYAIGSLSPGYWLVRLRGGSDVRGTGSGGTGATNVGRVLGKRGFLLVLALDLAKGAAIAALTRLAWPDVSPLWPFGAALAVVAGHIWPVWLGFRGGKGVATLIGAWLVLPWGAVALIAGLVLAVVLKPLLHSFRMAWLASLASLPFLSGWLLRDGGVALIASIMVLIVWWAHRQNFRDFLASRHGKAHGRAAPPSSHEL